MTRVGTYTLYTLCRLKAGWSLNTSLDHSTVISWSRFVCCIIVVHLHQLHQVGIHPMQVIGLRQTTTISLINCTSPPPTSSSWDPSYASHWTSSNYHHIPRSCMQFHSERHYHSCRLIACGADPMVALLLDWPDMKLSTIRRTIIATSPHEDFASTIAAERPSLGSGWYSIVIPTGDSEYR